MFQTLSPKVLNTEKLDKKFASLTKSKDSIQGLSMWIIRHKEFYKEIVNQWFDGLTKDMNALNMFYVANDVIQNCGRKKAPEFREAFATVLEQACSLEKVKEIKNEVMRMITIWHGRSIYDDVFYKKMQDALDSEIGSESTDEELDEAHVIANFKLENLINSLNKLKTLEDELSVKEEFLEDVEEPAITNIDNLIVKMESQKELKKVDKFQKLVEDYLSLSDKVMLAQKSALLHLNYSNIFYKAQFRDADKVASAYKMYGKKVNLVKKSLSEKMLTFPEPSPVSEEVTSDTELSLSSIHQSPDILQLSAINNNLSESCSQEMVSPKNSENYAVISNSNDKSEGSVEKKVSPSISSTKNLNEHIKLLKSPILDPTKSSKSDRKHLLSPFSDAGKSNENIIKSPVLSGGEKKHQMPKSPVTNDAKKSSSANILKSPSGIDIAKSSSNDNKFKSVPVANTEKGIKDKEKCLKESVGEDILKNSNDEKKPVKVLNIEQHVSPDENLNVSEPKENVSTAKNLSDSDFKNNESEELQGLSDFENIDFLLEKAYDERRSKSKLSIKRKIDNLLKSKQSKACKLSTEEDTKNKSVKEDTENKSISNVKEDTGDKSGSSVSLLETPMDITPCPVSDSSNLNEKVCDEMKSVVKDSDSTSDTKSLNTIERLGKESDMEETKEQDLNMSIDISQTSKSLDSETPKSVSLPFQALSDIPTELLKNILDKHRTNMNTSLNTGSGGSSANESSSDILATNSNQFSLTQNNSDDSNKCKSPDYSSKMVISNKVEYKIQDTIKNRHDMLGENTNICNPVSEAETAEDKSNNIKSTLLDNLQDILKCFTQKESRFEELKNSKTLSNMSSFPLENTLKVYSYIMQSCNNVNSLGSSNSTDKALPLNSNAIETTTADKNLSNVNYHQANDCFDPKEENLEIMDMEIDSEDDNS